MFHTFLIEPIYNAFIYLIGIMPGGDVGLAIIAMTLIIRGIFYPAFASSIRTQMGMQAVQGELDDINEKYKDNPEERGKRTMELFRQHKIRPFSSFLALLVQIPVFFALYYAFFREGLPKIDTAILYPFVHAPAVVHTQFLGVIDLLARHNLMFAVVVVALQYAVARLSLGRVKPAHKPGSQQQAAHEMQRQMMLYFLPVLMGVISYTLPAAVGLYFATGNIVSLGQEFLLRRSRATV